MQVAETEQRVLVELLRPALGELDDARSMGAEAQRTYIAALKREQIALRSGLEARGVVFRDVVSYYRVWNGFAATVEHARHPAAGLPRQPGRGRSAAPIPPAASPCRSPARPRSRRRA